MNKAQAKKIKRFVTSCFQAHPSLDSVEYVTARHCWRLNGLDVYCFMYEDWINNENLRESDKTWLVEANLTEEVAVPVLSFLKQLPKIKYSFKRNELNL